VLRHYCDLSIEETAREMSCTPGNVKSQTTRGIDKLRRMLDDPRILDNPPVTSRQERT
jgi:DNA-directed RNA polymerase specialized sigma24 family protein